MAGNSRSKNVIMTNEARLLKKWRLDRGLTLREVGAKVGKNHTTIAHIENGRMGIPKGDDLKRLLAVYGITGDRTLYTMARAFDRDLTPADKIKELIEKLPPEKVELVYKVAKEIAEGRALVFA